MPGADRSRLHGLIGQVASLLFGSADRTSPSCRSPPIGGRCRHLPLGTVASDRRDRRRSHEERRRRSRRPAGVACGAASGRRGGRTAGSPPRAGRVGAGARRGRRPRSTTWRLRSRPRRRVVRPRLSSSVPTCRRAVSHGGAGSTVGGLLAELSCPLVVVPGTVWRSKAQPILAGAGGGASTDAALRRAARLADETGRSLELVRVAGDGPLFRIDGLHDVRNVFLNPVGPGRNDLAEWIVHGAGDRSLPGPEASGRAAVSRRPSSTRRPRGRRSSCSAGTSRGRSAIIHIASPLRHVLTRLHCPVAIVPLTPRGGSS